MGGLGLVEPGEVKRAVRGRGQLRTGGSRAIEEKVMFPDRLPLAVETHEAKRAVCGIALLGGPHERSMPPNPIDPECRGLVQTRLTQTESAAKVRVKST
jgi:hypothetical protein